MKYRTCIRNNFTGEERIDLDEFDWKDEHGFLFMWTEGNFGCDCNRELMFALCKGELAPDRSCGSTGFSILWAEREDGTRLKVDAAQSLANGPSPQ